MISGTAPTTPPWMNDSPCYTPSRIPEFRGNPLIEALSLPPKNSTEAIARLMRKPLFDPGERDYSAAERTILPGRLTGFLFPMRMHCEVLTALSSAIFWGYSQRNPLTPDGQRRLHNPGPHSRHFMPVVEGDDKGGPSATAPIIMISGISGMGKTTTVHGGIRMVGKSVIRHSNYGGVPFPETQILYLARNVPNQCTPKALCKTYGDYADALLGQRLYGKYFENSRNTQYGYLSELYRIVASQHVGALILDCAENLLLAGETGVKEFIALLVNMRDELRVPIILVGTPRMAGIVKRSLSAARRSVLGGFFELKRPLSAKNKGFTALCRVAWKYQWVRKPVPFDDDIRSTLYDLSQGITGLMLTLFASAQVTAIQSGSESVTVAELKKTYRERFKPLHKIINALRMNDNRTLALYEDLYFEAWEEIKKDGVIRRISDTREAMDRERDYALGVNPPSADNPRSPSSVPEVRQVSRSTEDLLSAVKENASSLPAELG